MRKQRKLARNFFINDVRRAASDMRLHRVFITLSCLYLFGAVWVFSFFFNFFLSSKQSDSVCSDTSLHHVLYSETGRLDTSSRWRRLGSATYDFTAYLDNREPCEAWVTVLGFSIDSVPDICARFILKSGKQIMLKEPARKTKLNPYGPYIYTTLGPYAYSWLVPPDQDVLSNLKTVVVQQDLANTADQATEISITLPVYSAKTFGVCVESPLFGPIQLNTIIQSIELNRVLGSEWFTTYIYTAQDDMEKLLQEYVTVGDVEVVQNWGRDIPPSVHYYGQTLSINECAYRNMFRVKYLVYADINEFIVPRKSMSWQEMMKGLEKPIYGTYGFRHAFFLAKETNDSLITQKFVVPCDKNNSININEFNFLTHTRRSRKFYPYRERSKHITKPLFLSKIGVHEVFGHHEEFMETFVVPPDTAILHHYRSFEVIPDIVKKDLAETDVLIDKRALIFKRKLLARLKKRICRRFRQRIS